MIFYGLDLFCGAGGATKGYQDAFETAGHTLHMTGVDIVPQPNYYGDSFVQADAVWFIDNYGRDSLPPWGPDLPDFCFVHASPPCQAYTELNNDKTFHERLITPTRVGISGTGLPYVIENVKGARGDMLNPVTLRGEHFALNVRRERLFETNWKLRPPIGFMRPDREFLVYEHSKWRWTENVPVYGTGGRKAVEYWPYAMGVGDTWDDCWMTRAELAEAIPPAYTKFIGEQLLAEIERREERAA